MKQRQRRHPGRRQPSVDKPGSMAEAVSTAIGWLIAAGSTLLYSPMIFRVLRKKSAEGLALSTWWLKFSAYSATLVYNILRSFPLNTYVPSLVLR